MKKPADYDMTVRPSETCLSGIRILLLVMTIVSGLMCVLGYDLWAASGIVHGVCGLAFVSLAVIHVWHRRRRLGDTFGEPASWSQQARQHVLPLYVALFASASVSGITLACGGKSLAFHVGTGLLLGIVSILHAALYVGRKKCRM